MSELTQEQINWVVKQKAIKDKEEEIEDSNVSYQQQIGAVRQKASDDVNVIEAARLSEENVLKSELTILNTPIVEK